MAHEWNTILFVIIIQVTITGICIMGVLATDDLSLSLSSALDSNGYGIIGGQVTYFALNNGGYGVKIDDVDFSGEWCSHNLIASNRRCNYEIELCREGELFGDGNWLTEVISKQKVTKNVIIGDHCPSSLPNPVDLFDFTKVDYLSTTCPSLMDFTTNFRIMQNGAYFIKIRMHHNDFTTDWVTHESVFLNVDQTGNVDLSSSDQYFRTNEYWDNSVAGCTPGGKSAICPSPDACVDCNGNCVASGTDYGGGWVCKDGKWSSYPRTNEYWDNSIAGCTPGSKSAICPSPDACVSCQGDCISSGTDIGGGWICNDGKWSNNLYPRTNEYRDNSVAGCTPGSKSARCSSPDACVDCSGNCVASGTDIGGGWICKDGKWSK